MRPAGRWLCAALALLPAVAQAQNADTQELAGLDEPHLGLQALAIGGVNFVDSSSGPGLTPEPAFGADVSFQIGRLFFDYTSPTLRRALRVEGSYLYTGWTGGTDAVNTSTRYHYASLRATVGYPVKDWLFPYLTLGPAAMVETAVLRVSPASSSATGVVPGAAYGGGVTFDWAVSRGLSIALRAELLAYRRDYLDDLSLTAGAGLDF